MKSDEIAHADKIFSYLDEKSFISVMIEIDEVDFSVQLFWVENTSCGINVWWLVRFVRKLLKILL